MCGFFGIYLLDKQKKVNPELVSKATDTMKHRGPDDSGIFVEGNIGLGHRRLSIIDLAGGHQPMFNEDKSIAIVYNGEVYNFKEIRDELLTRGHGFKTNCDTEVIIHAYEEWGTESVKRFNGMFAFALWDVRKKRMWVVRDRLGIKPVYYFLNENKFICASEVKALFAGGLVLPELNEQVLDSYFTLGYVPGPQTMFKNIFKIMPGHFLVFTGTDLKDEEYWDFANVEEKDISFSEAKEKAEWLLKDSIKKRLMSDVPLGVFLSGGLDSSVVVALMKEVLGNQQIKTFTVSYDPKYKVGEDEYAKTVADLFHSDHHVFKLKPDDFFESIETLVEFAEEPIVEPAAIALYHISKLAREHAIVLLSGEGSDEIFGGYLLYNYMNKFKQLQGKIPFFIYRFSRMIAFLSNNIKFKKYADWLSLPVEKSYMGTSNYLTQGIKRGFYSGDFSRNKGEYLENTFDGFFSKVKDKKHFLNKLLYVDTKTWLVDDLLVKADKMTMATSVELRVPFLDYRLVEFAASLPLEFKIRNNEGKYILKSMMETRLPHEIIYRKKMGFPVPTKSWFGNDVFDQLNGAIIENIKQLPWLNSDSIKKLLLQHKSGETDHGKLLMMLVVFIMWRKKYLERKTLND